MATKSVKVTTVSTVTGDTLLRYNVYTDKPSSKTSLGTMTPAEAAAGKNFTIADGSNHNITVYPVGTTTGEFNQPSNIVVVDLSVASYNPSTDSSVLIALLSNTNTPQDISTTGGDGVTFKNNHMVVNTPKPLPTNSGGLNTFVAASNSGLKLIDSSTKIAASTPYTKVFEVAFTNMTPVNNEDHIISYGGANDTFGIGSLSTGNLFVRIGTATIGTTNLGNVAASDFTVNVTRIVTIKRDASNIVSVQFDDDAPYVSTAARDQETGIQYFGGGAGSSTDRSANCKIGRFIMLTGDKTGTDLTNIKNWVAAGTP